MQPKTINSLMKILRDDKNIQINGSLQKRNLRFMGYFHGYKGYRYCNSSLSLFDFKDFNELAAVYDYDMKLKGLLYPQLMFLETVIKNYSLECILEDCKSEKFSDLFIKSLTYYKSFPVGTNRYKQEMKKRLDFREHVFSVISRDYNRALVSHYYDKEELLPIWAIFELLSLGEFGTMLSCLNETIKKNISFSLGIKSNFDTSGKFPQMYVFALKDLRNAVAHNGTIFDTRFKRENINHLVSEYIETETGIKQISFDTIVDYVILIAFIMHGLKCKKTEIIMFINEFERIKDNFYKQVPYNIFSRIIHSDTKDKLLKIKQYCK